MLKDDVESCREKSPKNSIIQRIATIFDYFTQPRSKSISKGSLAIEAAITLPIICYLVFFILELMKINLTQTAIDIITSEATFDFAVNKKVSNISAIIAKHRPTFIPADNIRYWIRMYTDLAAMCATSPYGGEEIAYPASATDHSQIVAGSVNSISFLDSDKNDALLTSNHAFSASQTASYLNANSTPSGTVFVITFVCSYKFSSAFIKGLFSGGVNTKKTGGDRGEHYILWGRGVGIVK
ncbi:MAG: hypothetical protein LBO02_02540 [Holosporaceae bacterium]|jgi:hypothetical protein|nr:hypothetical protein [Holosporaceae bacterium]